MKYFKIWTATAVCCFAFASILNAQQPSRQYPGRITLAVDASEAPGKLFHAKIKIPVAAGPLTLLYPKWIPGEHSPTGPINELVGLRFIAGGQELKWRRDDEDSFAFHLVVPAGASDLEVALDYASPTEGSMFTAGTTASAQMMVLSWNWILLYPKGYPTDQIMYQPSIRLPAGWQSGSSLQIASHQENIIEYSPTSLTLLVDSPVIAGRYFKTVPLTPVGSNPAVEMNIAADSAAALQMSPELERHYKQLVSETIALFGATHYRDYHFLLSLSDHLAHFGLEHHESNDSRWNERYLIDPQLMALFGYVLPHEYVHSWNGKYRRPQGLATANYSDAIKSELLWVYEGLTDYLGQVLTARSGLITPEQFRDNLALTAATLEYRSGRTWRPLIDTTIAAPDLFESPMEWKNWRRSVDFYPEGDLIWLDADMTIRNLTGGKKSLDDFCRLFAGPPSLPLSESPIVKPYDFDEIVSLLNQVAPYDWKKFWEDRLWSTSPHAPMAGIIASGWKLDFDENPSELLKARDAEDKSVELTYSLGITLNASSGRILDVAMGSSAAKAGIGPGMRLVAVNERAWNVDILRDALTAAKTDSDPVRLLIENGEFFKTHAVDYHGGNRYPHLVRGQGPDLLSDILKQQKPGTSHPFPD
jgi:predicted metalloprotease with PDZ domain